MTDRAAAKPVFPATHRTARQAGLSFAMAGRRMEAGMASHARARRTDAGIAHDPTSDTARLSDQGREMPIGQAPERPTMR